MTQINGLGSRVNWGDMPSPLQGLGQAGEVGFSLDDEFIAAVFLQQVVAKLQAQCGELLVDFAQLCLLVGGLVR